ncbi:MAG TPA: sterol desaturase family protein [Acidimicrobiales bacterium]|nr:sterol desaturase family protein [Acidimicrobiales bacterium]
MTSTAFAVPGTGSSRLRLCLPTLGLAVATAAIVWFGVVTLERARSLGHVLAAGRAELVAPAVLLLVAIAFLCERVWPAERRPALAKGHLQDTAYFVVHVVTVVPIMTLLGVAFAELLSSHAGWIEVPQTAAWPRAPLFALTLVAMDAGNWLAHWADHRFGTLWRFHALHHSQEELNVLSAFRAHPFSHLAGFFLATVPVVVLTGDHGVAPELVTAYVCLGTLPHANVRWSFGPLGKIVVSPAYHRLHHSYEGSLGLNLGIVLTVWDVLARRARFPVKGEPPCTTGLAGRPLPTEQEDAARWQVRTLLRQLAEPFQPAAADARSRFGPDGV